MASNITHKVTRIFEDENLRTVWTYDYAKSKSNPLHVEIFHKKEPQIVKNSKKKLK